MKKCEERWPAVITLTTCVRGDTPPPHMLNQFKSLMNRIGRQNQSPTWSAAQFWALCGPTEEITVEWTFAPGLAVAAVLTRQEDGSAHVVRGGLNVECIGGDEAILAKDEPLFGISLGCRTDLDYGPNQVLQWIGHCAPGISQAEARALRDSREEEHATHGTNDSNGLSSAAVNGSKNAWDD